MYKYTFSFTLKLTTTLLQKLATFYMWKVKQKDDGMAKWAEGSDPHFLMSPHNPISYSYCNFATSQKGCSQTTYFVLKPTLLKRYNNQGKKET